jgi:hypothetical protein
MPDADGNIDLPAYELRVEDLDMGGPHAGALNPSHRDEGFEPLELSVDAGASAAQRRLLRVPDDQASRMRHDSDGDGALPTKAGHYSDVSFGPHRDLLHWARSAGHDSLSSSWLRSDELPAW